MHGIWAPAGFGKSTLLTEFVQRETRAVAWLTVDQQDDDPAVLCFDLAHALGWEDGPDSELLARLRAGAAGITPLAIPRLMELLHEHVDPLVVVLDDVHVLKSPGALKVVDALCSQTPPACSVVMAGRATPPLPLARVRAEGRLWELGSAELRMTPGEGAAMLRAAGLDLDEREEIAIVQHTEGWPAAIYLASVVVRGDPTLAKGGALRPDEMHLDDYFREEVLVSASPNDADFLVRTAILDELEPGLCAAVLLGDDASERLRRLAGAGVLVERVAVGDERYRVHPLFREMLEAELHKRYREQEPALHARASAAYAEAGDMERAVRHAMASGDLEVAAVLIAACAQDYTSHGRIATLQRWSCRFTAEQLAAHPQVAISRGWAAFERGDAEDAAHCATVILGGDPQRRLADGTTLEAMGLLLRASLGLRGQAASERDANRALEGIPDGHDLRFLPPMLSGIAAVLDDDLAGARDLLEDAKQRIAGVVPTGYSLILAVLALVAIEEGSWDEAEVLSSRAASQGRGNGIGGYVSHGIVWAVTALVHAHRGESQAGLEAADHAACNLGLQGPIMPQLGLETRLALAWAFALLGEGGRARVLLHESRARGALAPDHVLARWTERVEDAIAGSTANPAAGGSLTTAELNILRLLPTHLSLREIGEQVHCTRNTVKTHALSIYRKLDVTSRSEAVQRGRKLGLLGD